MTHQHLNVKTISEGIMLVTLKRSEKRNALNLLLMEELSGVFEDCQHSTSRVAILHGEGPVFCAGLDLRETSDSLLIEKIAQHVARLLKAIYTSSFVTIAAVQGDAVAGGAGIVAACDYALLAKGARMGFPETRRGLVAAQVSTLLCRQMRMRDVRELLLLGELVTSEKAVQMGLVNRQIEPANLLAEAIKVAEMVLLGAPEATRDTKRLLDRLEPASFFDDLETALSFNQSRMHSKEVQEGIAAFLEKRSPKWVGKDHASI